MKEREAIYSKPDFSDEDGIKSAELESEFADMNGYEAESDAGILLAGLGIPAEDNDKLMKDLDGSQKVKVLLAQQIHHQEKTARIGDGYSRSIVMHSGFRTRGIYDPPHNLRGTALVFIFSSRSVNPDTILIP